MVSYHSGCRCIGPPAMPSTLAADHVSAFTSQGIGTCSGQSCSANEHRSIRCNGHELRGMIGGGKCKWAALACQLKFCSAYQGIESGFREGFIRMTFLLA